MSIVKCKNCFKDVDTDYDEVMVFLGKYYYCQNCCDGDGIYELLDEMQTEIDQRAEQIKSYQKVIQDEYDTRVVLEAEIEQLQSDVTEREGIMNNEQKGSPRALFTEPSKEIDTSEMSYKYWVRVCYIENGDIESACFVGSTAAKVCEKRDSFLKAMRL